MDEKEILTEEELQHARKIAGVPWFSSRAKKIPIEKILAYREAGFSKRQVGQVYGVSATTINRRIIEHEKGSEKPKV